MSSSGIYRYQIIARLYSKKYKNKYYPLYLEALLTKKNQVKFNIEFEFPYEVQVYSMDGRYPSAGWSSLPRYLIAFPVKDDSGKYLYKHFSNKLTRSQVIDCLSKLEKYTDIVIKWEIPDLEAFLIAMELEAKL